MTAETLRRAAALMRERAEAATGDQWGWRHFGDDPDALCRVVYYPPRDSSETWQVVADDIWPETDAEHIASWHPAVALAVADWLDKTAERLERTCECHWPAEPFAVARTYLGESA